jgi:hypothetical protein
MEEVVTDLFDEDPSVGGEPRKRDGQVLVQLGNFTDGPGLLQLRNRLLFHAQDHAVLAPHTHHRGPTLHGLHRVLHLKQMPIRGKHSDGAIVRHGF